VQVAADDHLPLYFLLSKHAFKNAINLLQLTLSLATFPDASLQATITNCKFIGFRRVLEVTQGCKATMRDCTVDLTMRQAYGGEPNHMPVVSSCHCACSCSISDCLLETFASSAIRLSRKTMQGI
jgi:hypothetical protein